VVDVLPATITNKDAPKAAETQFDAGDDGRVLNVQLIASVLVMTDLVVLKESKVATYVPLP